MAEPIRGVVLDSGDTLVRPAAGAWWPGPGFERIVAERHPELGLSEDALARALRDGMAFLDAYLDTPVVDEHAEVEHFAGYYATVLRSLGLDPPDAELARKLAVALVEGDVVEPFPDTREGVCRMRRRGLALALVANSWPSLERHYRRLGMRECFDAMLISAQLGIWKPDERVYLAAASALGLPPEQLLYVDDDAEYVERARALGFHGLVMDRHGGGEVSSLADLERAIATHGNGATGEGA